MLTLAEAASLLGVDPSSLRHQVHNGKLRARLLGKTYVVSRAEIERYRRDSLGKPGRRGALSRELARAAANVREARSTNEMEDE